MIQRVMSQRVMSQRMGAVDCAVVDCAAEWVRSHDWGVAAEVVQAHLVTVLVDELPFDLGNENSCLWLLLKMNGIPV